MITNDGYFVLLPDGAVPPLHITEHSDVSIGYDLCTCTCILFSFSSFSSPVSWYYFIHDYQWYISEDCL